MYVLAATEYLARPIGRRPTPAIVWGRLDLLAECLAQGALDCVALPVDAPELTARLHGRLSALSALLPPDLAAELGLDARENRLLTLLWQAGASGLSRAVLTWALWGGEFTASRRLDVLISGLRKKLRNTSPGRKLTIHAGRGIGYALKVEPVDKL
ncbi:MAG: helix-turn-helix domain-containing protein [Treponema sp.]|nr:helix-turn-helix domain-containing protein [Treponema sp.]